MIEQGYTGGLSDVIKNKRRLQNRDLDIYRLNKEGSIFTLYYILSKYAGDEKPITMDQVEMPKRLILIK